MVKYFIFTCLSGSRNYPAVIILCT